MRTLVVHIGGIGDFLLSCPTLVHLGKDGPVELLGKPDRLDLAVAGGLAVAAHDGERHELHSAFHEPTPRLRELLSRFDRCILWMRDDGQVQDAVRRCGVTRVHAFPGLPPPDWPAHASRYYLECLGVHDAPPLRLAIEPSPTRHDVVIHPGSGGERKKWPPERFIALAAALTERGRSVAWCLGPAEEGAQLPGHLPVLRISALVALARELAAAHLYIGNDSGITHLAAAVGCPTIAVFGPTDPPVWAPLGNHVTVVQGTPWPTVDAVLALACGKNL